MWNAAVTELGGSVLQSHEWGEFRRRHGWRPLRLQDRDGSWAAQVLLKKLPGLGTLAYAPYGPLTADPEDLPAAAAAVAAHARRRGAHLLEIEPRVPREPNLEVEGFRKSPNSVQPRCTLIVPVLGNDEAQLAALPKDARYGVRRAHDIGIEAETSGEDVGQDLEGFLDLLEETARRQRFAVRPREYYRRFVRELPARLVLARREGERRPIAGALILFFKEEAYYLYGASAHFEGKNLYASYLVQLEALSAARREGASRYDLWGIPCRPHVNHPLWGVYQFKKKFAGPDCEERYAGAYKKYLSPLQSHLARAGISSYYTLQRLRGKSRGPIAD